MLARASDVTKLRGPRLCALATPVFRAALSSDSFELWVKNDGLTNPRYGGNKVRKLEWLLLEAERRGARRVVTMGAAGSHHVLATTLFAAERGLPVTALLGPQPFTRHAEQTLATSLALGVDAIPIAQLRDATRLLGRVLRRGDYLIPAGGSNVVGSLGYVAAAEELVDQIRGAELPVPDVIVVALGSGGTAAGLLAGVVREGLPTRVLGVSVALGQRAARGLVLALAALLARRCGGSIPWRALERGLLVDASQRGAGYGFPTASGRRVRALEPPLGLSLDATYSEKTLAAALSLGPPELRAGLGLAAKNPKIMLSYPRSRPLRVLYWHTLSEACNTALTGRRAARIKLPAELRALLRPP